MTASDLLAMCLRAGIVLQFVGGRLVFDAPKGAMTEVLRAQLDHHKPTLVALLAPPRAFVTLQRGPTLPVEAIELALALEARGIPLRTDNEHQFIVPSDPRLSPEDHAVIGRWRQYLGSILEYQAEIT